MTLKLMKLKQRHSVYTGEGSEIFTLVWPKLLRPHPITVLQQHTSSCQAILSLLCIQRQVKQCQQGQGREGQGGENQLLYTYTYYIKQLLPRDAPEVLIIGTTDRLHYIWMQTDQNGRHEIAQETKLEDSSMLWHTQLHQHFICKSRGCCVRLQVGALHPTWRAHMITVCRGHALQSCFFSLAHVGVFYAHIRGF